MVGLWSAIAPPHRRADAARLAVAGFLFPERRSMGQ
jgi:hypothetical protein